MTRAQLYQLSAGYLGGTTPNGQRVVVGHRDEGHTGFELYSKGQRFVRYGQSDLQKDFGIAPREKKTGSQVGYPSEPVIKALWRHLLDRYNRGEPDVIFMRTPPRA